MPPPDGFSRGAMPFSGWRGRGAGLGARAGLRAPRWMDSDGRACLGGGLAAGRGAAGGVADAGRWGGRAAGFGACGRVLILAGGGGGAGAGARRGMRICCPQRQVWT